MFPADPQMKLRVRTTTLLHRDLHETPNTGAVDPLSELADLLQIPVTLPVLEIVRVGTSAKDGRPIEVTMYVIPSDRVEQVVVLKRDESAAWPWPDLPGASS